MQAAILAQLCDNLLDLRTIRNEIDRREAEGHWVAGYGGEGGIFPMRSPEERARRNEPEPAEGAPPVKTRLTCKCIHICLPVTVTLAGLLRLLGVMLIIK